MTLIHRAIATSRDAIVRRYAPKLVKFVELLKDSIILEHMKIRFRTECLWGIDDPTLSKTVDNKTKEEFTDVQNLRKNL